MDEEVANGVRRLAVVLHADVVGFTALMGADEAATHAALSRAMGRAREIIATRNGRVVGTAGDAFLAEFPSVVDAVRAAVEFQSRGAEDAGGSPLVFRVGINLGDVIVQGEDIFGDGVNLASRVQALAPPGGIAITDAIHTQLGSRLETGFADGGLHKVKNVARPVHIHIALPPFEATGPAHRSAKWRRLAASLVASLLITIGIAAGLALVLSRPEEAPPPDVAADPVDLRPVVAVLPFTEPGAEETWFADGMTGDVIANLGRFPELLILSWNAVAPYRNATPEMSTARDILGARYVLRGSIRRNDAELRVSLELSDARDGLLIWSKRFEAPYDDVFELQDRITGDVAGALAIGLAKIEQQRTLTVPTETLDAYELVLRARAKTRRIRLADNLEARALFLEALEKDPDYPDALAGVALTYIAEAWWGWSEWPEASVRKAREAAEKALGLDPRNVRAAAVRAEALYLAGETDAARAVCDRALDINPNDPATLGVCGGVHVYAGETETGVPLLELSLRIDPELTGGPLSDLAIGYYVLGAFEKAADVLGHGAARGFDELPAAHATLAAINARLGRPEAARREVERTLQLSPFFDPETFAYNVVGNPDKAAELLADLRAAGFE